MRRIKIFILIFLIKFVSADDCGQVQIGFGNIFGGEYSVKGQWPWLASLFVKNNYICGASLISEKFILGAAHCVHPKDVSRFATSDYHTFLGRHDLRNSNERGSVKREFSEIFLHPDWNSSVVSYDGDVALFEMKTEIMFTDYIQPICLPSESAKIFDVEGTIVGYGFTENSETHENLPKHVKIKSVDHGSCVFSERNYILARIGSNTMFCAGMRGTNPCRGDSGGPFMVKIDEKWIINGIVSSSKSPECHENDFVLFTQVPKFLGWIKEILKGGRQLECRKDPEWNNEKICFTESLKILKPNLRVISISLDEDLNFSEIEYIEIRDAEVHYLPDFSIANEKFPNFKSLTIVKSGLKELDRSKLALLPQLTELDVRVNQIKELPQDIFDDLINLEFLNIADNQVKILPQKLLWKLSKLKLFRASGNQIEAIPARFFEMNKNVERIVMVNNKISRIEIDLRLMSKLKGFFLNGNRCINKDFMEDKFNLNEFQNIINEKCL